MLTQEKDDDLSDLHVLPNGELGGKVPEELHALASKESIGGYIKGMLILALLLWGVAYLKHKAEQKVEETRKDMPVEQQKALDTYTGPGM